jgi:hypothetical protein
MAVAALQLGHDGLTANRISPGGIGMIVGGRADVGTQAPDANV